MDLRQIADEVSKEITIGKQPIAKPTVLVLVGLQYSGKSYLAGLITNKNYAHFWATKIKMKYQIKNPEMIEVAKLVIASVSAQGFNTVIDFVNHKYADRKSLQNAAEAAGISYRIIFIDTSRQVRLQRRDENIAEGDHPGRRVITLEQMNEFEAEFEAPRDDENVTRLQSQSDIDHFLNLL